MLILYTTSHWPAFSIWSSKRRKLTQRKAGCEGRWMNGRWDGDYTEQEIRDLFHHWLKRLPFPFFREKWNESKQKNNSRKPRDDAGIILKSFTCPGEVWTTLTYRQSLARPCLWQVTIFNLIFQGSVKKQSFLNLLGRLYHSFLCAPIALYSYII